MLTSCCLIALALTRADKFTFAGGDVSALAEATSAQRNQAVAALVYDAKPMKAFSMPVGAGFNFAKDMPRYCHWTPSIGSGIGLSTGKLPREYQSLYSTTKPSTWEMKPYAIPRTAIGETVHLTTDPGTYVELRTLEGRPWPKPLHVHWYYEKMAIVLVSEGRSAKETLDAVARAVGGKLVESDKEYDIDFDAKEFKERAISSLSAPLAFDPQRESISDDPSRDPFASVEAAERVLMLESVRALSAAELTSLFERKDKGKPIPAPFGSPLYTAIMNKLDAYRQLIATPNRGAAQAIEMYRGALDSIDFSKPVRAYFSSPLHASMALAAKDGGTLML